jgi:hypothetical protein
LESKFIDGIQLSKAHSNFNDSLEYQIIDTSNYPKSYSEIRSAVVKANNDLNDDIINDAISALLDSLKQERHQEIKNQVGLLCQRKYINLPIFVYVDIDIFYDLIISQSNFVKKQINILFQNRYKDVFVPTLEQEKPNLIKLQKYLQNYIDQNHTKAISISILNSINKELLKIIEIKKW